MSGEPQSQLLMAFIGDDFTGSTDAMESLARCGAATVLFTEVPTPAMLARYPAMRAFGIAGLTRSLATERIEEQIQPAFAALRKLDVPIIHFKTCSTFDSSPSVGSIGRVIDVGMRELGADFVPVVVGAPALGRYCAFGNLFARCGAEAEVYRLDRHPSMSRHPVTPMDEADLRRHLAKQTRQKIGLVDLATLELDEADVRGRIAAMRGRDEKVVLFDAVNERQLAKIGGILADCAEAKGPLFVVGSSGVESALCAHWIEGKVIGGVTAFSPPGEAGPIVAVCGSCSPVTAGQIDWAKGQGFVEVKLTGGELAELSAAAAQRAAEDCAGAIREGKSVCLHGGGGAARRGGAGGATANNIAGVGTGLGRILRDVLGRARVRRVLVAGGDTSGLIAQSLRIESLEMIGELTRGSPLCVARSADERVDGLEITFKGGQIGSEDFFGMVRGR